MFDIKIPYGAQSIIQALEDKGFEAYVVGGCVRDSLLGVVPKDWDICTSAIPEDVKKCFNGFRIIETGLKHGTVTIVIDDDSYEVTTFRTDGDYSDNRHPDNVSFVTTVTEDLSRRDFTINAMAYSNTRGLIDPFDGQHDLLHETISCVGDPDDRFKEDALRLMRALRFASTYGFKISDKTSEAIHRNVERLDSIARERISSELCKLICGKGALDILLDYSDVIASVIPEIRPCIGFEQNSKYHCYNVYDHIAHSVSNYNGDDIVVKLALLLHDIGKPQCYSEDENGGHFYGHQKASCDIADWVMHALRFDKRTHRDVTQLVFYHDDRIAPTPKSVKRWLNRLGEKQLHRLLRVKLADMLAHTEGTQIERVVECFSVRKILNKVLQEQSCFCLKDLAVNGNDMIDLGIPRGKNIGYALEKLLHKVIDGDIPNEKDKLISYAKEALIWIYR